MGIIDDKTFDNNLKICIIIVYMLTDIHVFAAAKINIGLRVLPRRLDGFHAIESIFQTVNLNDELIVHVHSGTGGCKVECGSMALPDENTVTSTYKAFCKFTGMSPAVSVELKKRIPSGGGLGGGSADAAAFLKALCTVTGTSLSMEQQDEIAGEVGSDVFFFLHCPHPGCAVVAGRGEKIRPITPRNDLHILLVFPGVHSSTGEAYGLVDEYMASGKIAVYPAFAELETVYNSPVRNWNFVNSFTPAISRKYPVIRRALADVCRTGAGFFDMSGSGSTVFGVFDSASAAENARRELAQCWNGCMVV